MLTRNADYGSRTNRHSKVNLWFAIDMKTLFQLTSGAMTGFYSFKRALRKYFFRTVQLFSFNFEIP